MTAYEPYLEWIDTQKETGLKLLDEWVSISSETYDYEGILKMQTALIKAFSPLADGHEKIEVGTFESSQQTPARLGGILAFKKRKEVKNKILVGGHLDTVHQEHFGIKKTDAKWIGPGVADMKGGLLVVFLALSALERSPYKEKLGWELLINADEEIGSQGSAPIIKERAKGFPVALWYEPSFDDGLLAGKRKGSSNIEIHAKGVEAHAGRDLQKGKNAILALVRMISSIEERKHPDLSVNYGKIEGGKAFNIVAGKASLKINVRSFEARPIDGFFEIVENLKEIEEKNYGIEIKIVKLIDRPPKPFPEQLFTEVNEIAKIIGLKLDVRDTGGVSDGNLISSVNVPCLDTLGPISGRLHTQEEWVDINSIFERAKLSALILMKRGSTC